MATQCVLFVALSAAVVHGKPFPDWLVTRVSTPTELLPVGSGRFRLTNGLISRDFVITPDFATVEFYSHEHNESLLRAIRSIDSYQHSLLVLCKYSKFRIKSNSYFSIQFDSKQAQLFEIFEYLPSPISYSVAIR